jgi:hypothetical protein
MKALEILVVVSMLSVSVAAAQDSLPWTVETAFPNSGFPGEEGGPCARVAINPANGSPVVALLKNSGEPGDSLAVFFNHPFGAYDGWDFVVWNHVHDISDLDMDFWSSPTVWKVGLSFRDQSDQSLHFIEIELEPGGGGIIASADHQIQDATSFDYGVGTSVRYDSTGTPHIACSVRSSMASDSLMYATPVASGGNCGVGLPDDGKWSCVTIEAGTDVGRDPSLTLDASDQPAIAYTKPYGQDELDIVFVARPTAAGTGNCSHSTHWDCQYPDYMIGANHQSKASAYYDQSSADTGLHVAFMYESAFGGTGIGVRHARYVGDGSGNCSATNDWVCDAVPLLAEGDAMELGTNAAGEPMLAFHTAALDEVAFVEYVGVPWAGNCGTTDTWHCGALEPDIGTDTMGEWLDLAVDQHGDPHVVYSKFGPPTYQYELKYAVPWLFRDRFESGNTTAWSLVVD